jgi:FKBP-type peptidyl-prolyl cis-trans isomerase FkpA
VDDDMKHVILCAALALAGVSITSCRGKTPGGGAASAGVPHTDDEKALYALGTILGERISEFNLSPQELEIVKRGLTDSVTGARPLVETQQFAPRLRQLSQARQARRAEAERRRGQQFAEQAAREPGAQRLPSGLIYREIRPGNGPQPAATDTVTVHYRGTLTNGREFDSSYTRNEPATFPLRGVIPCWTEGVQRMHVGGKARLVCPSDIAYGNRAQREIPPGSTLVFEIELVGIRPAEQTPQPSLQLPQILGGQPGMRGPDGGAMPQVITLPPRGPRG